MLVAKAVVRCPALETLGADSLVTRLDLKPVYVPTEIETL